MTCQTYHSLQPTLHGKGAIQRLVMQTHRSLHHPSLPFPDTPRTPPPALSEEYFVPDEPPTANIYSAIYSGVPVYEMMSRGIAVMRRRADSFLNATQILKVAGLEKGKRTKILEREILQGEHEKVQGGYGKYQGTWVPFERGRELAEQYGVDHYLKPLFVYDTNAGGNRGDKTPTKEQAMAAQRKEAAAARASGTGSPVSGNLQPQRKRQKLNISPSLQAQNAQFVPAIPSPGFGNAPTPVPSGTTTQSYNATPPEPSGAEKHRSVLMAIFLNEDPNHVPELLSNPNPPADLDIDLVIDDQGHTALHWAAALARINILNHLIEKGTDIARVNYMGESALDRAVLVTNNYDIQSFPELLHALHTSIKVTDKKCRSVLHHIALTAGIKGRAPAARYYMECLLEWIARNDGDFKNIIDIQDKNGDTALNIAARVGNKSLIDQLVDVGASRLIENKVGLKPEDFGVEERGSSSSMDPLDMPQTSTEENAVNSLSMEANGIEKSDNVTENDKVVVPSKRGRELIEAVEQIVNDVECDYEAELSKKKEELFKSQQDLRTTTRELAMLRRQITSLRTKHDHLAEANQRVVNLEQALHEETALAQSLASAGSEANFPCSDAPLTNEDADAIMDIPETTTDQTLDSEICALQFRINAYTRNDADLRSQIIKLQNHAAERELQCKRLIATCCNVPLDRVDGLLDPLMQAVDADGSDIDLARVAGFMLRVKQQEGWEMHNRRDA